MPVILPAAFVWRAQTVLVPPDSIVRLSLPFEALMTRKSLPAPPRIVGVAVAGMLSLTTSSPPPALIVSAPPPESMSSLSSPVFVSAVVSPSP